MVHPPSWRTHTHPRTVTMAKSPATCGGSIRVVWRGWQPLKRVRQGGRPITSSARGRERVADPAALRQLRGPRFFGGWGELDSADRIEASQVSLHRLIDDLVALGPDPTEAAARQAVEECVRRFNALDDGWICTIEREDICEQTR